MISLIKKDFKLSFKINLFVIIYALFISAVGVYLNEPLVSNLLYAVSIVVLTFATVIFTNGYDDKNKSEIILNSLPLDRRNIVRSKYIILIFYTLMYGLVTILFTKVLIRLNVVDGGGSVSLQSIIAAVNIVLLFYTIYYPFYFKLGEGLRSFNAILWVFVMLGPTMLGRGMAALYKRGLLDRLMNVDLDKINFYLLGIVLVLYYISLQISKRIYGKREF